MPVSSFSTHRLPSSSGWACLDHHRTSRTGIPEVIYGENKSAEQITAILNDMLTRPYVVMATRIDPKKADQICKSTQTIEYHQQARMLVGNACRDNMGQGKILVVTAGTSDIPVAEEAFVTCSSLGHETECIYDVGVAGIHRLLAKKEALQQINFW